MVCTTLQLQIKFCLLCHILLEIEILQQLQYLYNLTTLTDRYSTLFPLPGIFTARLGWWSGGGGGGGQSVLISQFLSSGLTSTTPTPP